MKRKNNNTNKIVITFLVIIIVILLGVVLFKTNKTPTPVAETPKKEATTPTPTPITVSIKNIKEENFSGTEPVISGSGTLVTASRTYIDKAVADFRKEANMDVPDMREKFGADAPMATYTIDIEAKYLPGSKTDSMVMSSYTYTGGANGNSSYHVITTGHSSGKILSLSSVVKTDEQAAFTALVQKQLNAWVPDGSDAPVVFPDEVKALKFSSFSNWSLDDKNLTIYFDKYAIGPGVLGAVAFPVPLTKIQTFLNPGF